MTDDRELLRRYARDRDDAAFAELVRRHIDVVYATALRQCRGQAASAQDATQVVFVELARRAGALRDHPALLGWLHTTARFTAMKILRTESRRLARERQAVELGAVGPEREVPVDWDRLHPLLDGALGELKDRDRAAILLRFFESKSLSEVGAALRLSERAARSCVDRALDKLRDRLANRGLRSTTAALAVALAQPAVAAPAGLAASVAVAAVATAGPGTGLLAVFTMKKIILGVAGLLLLAEFTVATAELTTRRALEAERQDGARTTMHAAIPEPLPSAGASPVVATGEIAAGEREERARLQQRLAILRGRPPGVTDSQMRGVAAAGRATPQEAAATLAWALRSGDLDAVAGFVRYTDDTPENRAAFMGNFSDATRARYRSPERLMAAFSFAEALGDPPVAQQFLGAQTFHNGAQTVTMWNHYASGREDRSVLPLEETPDGWSLAALSLAGKNNGIPRILARVDPTTGEVLPPKK